MILYAKLNKNQYSKSSSVYEAATFLLKAKKMAQRLTRVTTNCPNVAITQHKSTQ